MNDKKGFTLIELLAVIVILAVILAIAGTAVIKSINDSREKVKYIAAQDIVNIAEAYMVAEKDEVDSYNCVSVKGMIDNGYVESDATNPLTGENISGSDDMREQEVCKTADQEQDNYKLQEDDISYFYEFDGYRYKIKK
jgi:type IV pilus assembly protein PilA